MKAISLWQPWASAIACGHKRIETRSWETLYRGKIAIHASKRPIDSEGIVLLSLLSDYKFPGGFPLGAIVATCELEDVRLIEAGGIRVGGHLTPLPSGAEYLLGDYRPSRFAWMLTNVVALAKPVFFRGRQGLFDVPDELLK
jgi:hypothetical protein